jgi:hypothetical protein
VCTKFRGDKRVKRGVDGILQESDKFDKVQAALRSQPTSLLMQ